MRRIAEQYHLATAKRKDSQGICFVGKVDLPVFLQQAIAARKGNIHEILATSPKYAKRDEPASLAEMAEPYHYTVRDGKKVGEHNGAHFYTIGQRKGLGIGGRKESLFIISTDVKTNTIYVGEGDSHPGLYRRALRLEEEHLHWVNPDERLGVGESRHIEVRIRYRQPLQGATLHVTEQGVFLQFDEPQRAVAAGQFAAWYDGERVVGSGVIVG